MRLTPEWKKELLRKRAREYVIRHRAEKTAYQKIWRKKNSDKVIAHQMIQTGIRNGSIIRPNSCNKCKKQNKLHAHHGDYSKPLAIQWLCVQCHRLEHGPIPKVPRKIYKGEKSNLAKLNEDQVISIRKKLGKGFSQTELSIKYGVSWGTIHYIKEGLTWKNV